MVTVRSPEEFIERMKIKDELATEDVDDYMVEGETGFDEFKRLIFNCLKKKKGFFGVLFNDERGYAHITEYDLGKSITIYGKHRKELILGQNDEDLEDKYIRAVLSHYKDIQPVKEMKKQEEPVTLDQAQAIHKKYGDEGWSIIMIN